MGYQHITNRQIAARAVRYAIAAAVIGWGLASAAMADTGKDDMFSMISCPQPLGTAPQYWAGQRPTYATFAPDPQHGVIRYQATETGGSGGHSPKPDVETPAPVGLGEAGAYLAAALFVLGRAWRKLV